MPIFFYLNILKTEKNIRILEQKILDVRGKRLKLEIRLDRVYISCYTVQFFQFLTVDSN